MKLFTLLFLVILMTCDCLGQSVFFSDASNTLDIPHSYGNTSEMGAGVSFVDINQDGWDDITLSTDSTFGIGFYINNGDGSFSKTNLPGLYNVGLNKQILWADIDNDGDYDLFAGANETGNHLYLNNGELQFTDITDGSGLDSIHVDNNSFGAVFSDFNDDGNLDLYVSNRTINGVYLPNGNIMHYGNGDGTFVNVTETANAADADRAPLAVCAFDYDKDGQDDIYLAQDKNFGNTMLHNLNGSIFEHSQEQTGTDFVMDGMNSEIADIDNNGYLDIHVTDVYGGSLLLMNDGNGNFTNEASERGCDMLGDFGWGGSFVDIDNDLDLDIYVSNSTLSQARKNRLFINDGTGNFDLANGAYGLETDSLRSFGNMFGDINNDGFPDIVTNNYDAESQVWQNSGNSNNWLKYKLEGTASNRDATGSFLYFYIDGNAYMRTTQWTRLLSQQSYTKILGLGEHEQADSVLIAWPSGFEEWHYDLQAGEIYQFTEGETYTTEILSSEGTDICAGAETILTINGDAEEVVWNGDVESENFVVTSSGIYSVLVTNEFGVQTVDSIEIYVNNEVLNVEVIDGLSVCPDVTESQVIAQVTSNEVYSLLWDGVAGTDSTFVAVGSHMVTVIDELGCQVSHEFEVLQTEALIYNEILTNASCFGENDGQVVLDINGASPFDILINEMESGIVASNLTAGIYSVQITDDNGCSISGNVEISEPEEISYELTTTPDYGAAEGSITVFNVSGGTAPYTLNGESNLELTSLTSGGYDLELCDQSECCLELDTLVEFQIGVEEQLEDRLNLFPNPVLDYVTIDLPSGYGMTDLVIRDIQGKVIDFKLVSQTQNKVVLDFRALASGKYILESFDGLLKTTFLVK